MHLDFRKWDDREHWQSDGLLLGDDGYGVWLGFPRGSRTYRPGHSFELTRDYVILVPRELGWSAMLFDEALAEQPMIYIDLASTTTWTTTDTGLLATLIDLDLDVVEESGGRLFIDDEDEFLEHQQLFGYPSEVIARVRADADALLEEVRAHHPPFDEGTVRPWLQTLRSL